MISAIILAAGTSARMGRPKLLLPFRGVSLIRSVTLNVLASAVDEVLVVSGYRAAAVNSEIEDLPVRIVYNPNYLQGQGTTLAAGARQVNPASECFLVFMGDQPLIDAAIINRLIKEYRQSNCFALRPEYRGQPGHPVLFHGSLLEPLKTLGEDEGARKILARLGNRVVNLPVSNQEVIIDVDTPEAYLNLIQY
ncbi:MAG: nucleotidyltransferase family protein [Syntrophomonas sp.]